MFNLKSYSNDLRVFALASGSSGNATLVQAGDTHVLIDAGLPIRTLGAHLARHGVGVGQLDAVLLTHEHHDHCSGAGPIARRYAAPLIANAPTLEAIALRDALPFATRELPVGGSLGVGSLGVRSFAVPHDACAPVGYVIEAGGRQVVYFTDAGSVTAEMRTALHTANLAIIEANHDLDWLLRGPYAPPMKERVASPTGHLSNADCADLLAERLEANGTLCVWLAHLSRVNNSPALAKRSVRARVERQTRVPFALDVALRDHPSVSWRAGSQAVQLALL